MSVSIRRQAKSVEGLIELMGTVVSRRASGPRYVEVCLSRIPQAWWSASLVSLYTLVIVFVSQRHVLWRDEAQMWLIGRASGSIAELFANMEYENRPALWFLVVWPVSQLSGNPEAIKVLTIVAASLSAYIVTRCLPLFRLEQVAILSGFLFLVGYATTNTGYMVGVLFLLLWYVAYARGSFSQQFIFLALVSATHVLFLLLAVPLWCLSAFLWLKGVFTRQSFMGPLVVVAGALSATVIAWSAWLILPPDDYGFTVATQVPIYEAFPRLLEYSGNAVRAPGIALPLLLTKVPIIFWSLPVVTVVIVSLLRGRWYAVAPVVGLMLIVANGVFGYGPYWWHSGLVVISILLIVLLTRSSSSQTPVAGLMLLQSVAWWAIIAMQIVVLFSVPGRYLWTGPPYSGAKAAASSIQIACPDGCPLVTNDDVLITAVSAYLSGESIYSVKTDRSGTFTVWDQAQLQGRPAGWDQIRDALRERGPGAHAVVTGLGIPPSGFVVVAEPSDSVWPDERFLVVRLSDGT